MLRRLSTIVLVASACTPATAELPLPESMEGSGGSTAASGDGPDGCEIDGELWVDAVAGDNANRGSADAPVADLDAALGRAASCTRIHLRAAAVGYTGACIVRDNVEILGEGGRPRIDALVTCDERLAGLFVRASHVRITGIDVDVSAHPGEEARAVVLSGLPDAPIADVRVLDVGATGPGPGAAGRALLSSSLCFACAFEGCRATGSEGEGIGFDNHQDDGTIRDNVVRDAGGACILVNGEPTSVVPGDPVQDGVSSGFAIERNVVSGCGDAAIHLGSAIAGRVIDNVVTATTAGALLLDDDSVGDDAFGSRDHLVAHNTFECSACVVAAIRVRAGSSGNRIVDSLVVAPDAAVELDDALREVTSFDHNGYDTALGFVDAGGNAIDLGAWQALGFDAGSLALSADATFVGADDLHLRAGASAIDAGVDVEIELDAAGGPRIVGAAPDLGAYEYGG